MPALALELQDSYTEAIKQALFAAAIHQSAVQGGPSSIIYQIIEANNIAVTSWSLNTFLLFSFYSSSCLLGIEKWSLDKEAQ